MKEPVQQYSSLQVAALRGIVAPFVIVWIYARERSFRTLMNIRWV